MKNLKLRNIMILTVILSFGIVGSAGAASIALTGTIRDFQDSHPDFESLIAVDPGIVQPILGPDKKPVYAGGTAGTTHGQTAFDQWYRDVPGVNMSTDYTLTLDNTITTDPNVYTFYNPEFFPIDNQLLGNQGRSHNYHFTFELHSQFTYQGGEAFNFIGDDDVWVFIDNQLVVDLGGVHGPISGGVTLDSLGLTMGETYDFDFFFAERHTVMSHFRIDTSIELQNSEPIPEPGTVLLVGLGLVALVGFGRRTFRK